MHFTRPWPNTFNGLAWFTAEKWLQKIGNLWTICEAAGCGAKLSSKPKLRRIRNSLCLQYHTWTSSQSKSEQTLEISLSALCTVINFLNVNSNVWVSFPLILYVVVTVQSGLCHFLLRQRVFVQRVQDPVLFYFSPEVRRIVFLWPLVFSIFARAQASQTGPMPVNLGLS